jgi:hypothetical protein
MQWAARVVVDVQNMLGGRFGQRSGEISEELWLKIRAGAASPPPPPTQAAHRDHHIEAVLTAGDILLATTEPTTMPGPQLTGGVPVLGTTGITNGPPAGKAS